MDPRKVAAIATTVVVLMAVASGWAILALPGDAQVPIHFGMSGKADAWERPIVALSLLPALAIALLVLFAGLARSADPGLARSHRALGTTSLAVLGLLAAVHGLMIAAAFGVQFNVTRLAILLTGLLLIVVGNVLGKVRPNHWLGIRTPWTLADDRVWDRTHRFGGWLFVSGGTFLMLCAVVTADGHILTAALLSAVTILVLAPLLKSYLLSRQ